MKTYEDGLLTTTAGAGDDLCGFAAVLQRERDKLKCAIRAANDEYCENVKDEVLLLFLRFVGCYCI